VALTFDQARELVLHEIGSSAQAQPVLLAEAEGRVLAEEILADRDYPPFRRSTRDGYAIRAADAPGELLVLGQVRAGEAFSGTVGPGQAVEIMTGAPLPEAADAVVMVEHTERVGEHVRLRSAINSGDNFTPRGADAAASEMVLHAGRRIGFAEAGVLA
jgi:molybdopterin molybdotransferase